MKKIKKFNLNQNRMLSLNEMEKLSGGEYLYTSCTYENIGKPCMYTIESNHYSGVCTYEYNFSSGSGTSSSSRYFCK